MKIVYIIWKRQLKRYLRSPSRIIGSLGQPLLFLLALGYGLGSVFKAAGQGDYLKFMTPGVVVMSVLFTAIFSGIEIIWDRQFGFLKETLVAPVSRTEIMVGRTLGGATVSVIQGLIVLVLSTIFGFRLIWGNLIYTLLFLFLIAILFTALGTAIASKMEDMQGFPILMNFIVMPMFFLSGSMFPLTGLPKVLNIITRINPLTYGVDGIRAGLIGIHQISVRTDVDVILGATLLCVAVGSYLFNRIRA